MMMGLGKALGAAVGVPLAGYYAGKHLYNRFRQPGNVTRLLQQVAQEGQAVGRFAASGEQFAASGEQLAALDRVRRGATGTPGTSLDIAAQGIAQRHGNDLYRYYYDPQHRLVGFTRQRGSGAEKFLAIKQAGGNDAWRFRASGSVLRRTFQGENHAFINGTQAQSTAFQHVVDNPGASIPNARQYTVPGTQIFGLKQGQDFYRNNRIDFDTPIRHGFRDGGRRFSLQYQDGAQREIIHVDLKRDPHLRQAITQVQQHFQRHPNLNDRQKMRYLARTVDGMLTGNKSDDALVSYSENLPLQEVLLGRMIEDQAGVCRHRSLLLKILAEQTGMSSAMVRGLWRSPQGGGGGHAWNEMRLANGKRYLVDTMHRRLMHLPDPDDWWGRLTADRRLRFYQDVQGNPLYV